MNAIKCSIITIVSFFYLGNNIIKPMHNPGKNLQHELSRIKTMLSESHHFKDILEYFDQQNLIKHCDNKNYKNSILTLLIRMAYRSENLSHRDKIIEFVIFVIKNASQNNNPQEYIHDVFLSNCFNENFVTMAVYRGFYEVVSSALPLFQAYFRNRAFKKYLMSLHNYKTLLYWAAFPPEITIDRTIPDDELTSRAKTLVYLYDLYEINSIEIPQEITQEYKQAQNLLQEYKQAQNLLTLRWFEKIKQSRKYPDILRSTEGIHRPYGPGI